MRATTPLQPFQLPEEFREDWFLTWLREHAHEDLWMPRVPLAVKERIRARWTGQKRTTLLRVWMAIRSLLLARSVYGGSILSVRDIADEADVSRSRLCGNDGYIQDLLDIGVLGVTVVDEGMRALKDLYQGRTLYHIDMAALEAESLVWLRRKYSHTEKDHVPRRTVDPRQGNLLDLVDATERREAATDAAAAPDATRAGSLLPPAPSSGASSVPAHGATPATLGDSTVLSGSTMVPLETMVQVPHEARLTPIGTALAPSATAMASMGARYAPSGARDVPHGTAPGAVQAPMTAAVAPSMPRVVPRAAVGMDGIGRDGKGGEGEERPLTLRDMAQLIPTIVQQAVVQLSTQQPTLVTEHSAAKPRGPAAPPGEPPVALWPRELWTLYKQGEPDPIELERLSLLPGLFDEPSGGHGAYWVSRAILMLTEGERLAPITVPYLRGVLERMRRANDWSTAQLEAPPEEHEGSTAHRPRERNRAPAAAPPTPPQAVAAVGAASTEERTALTIFRQYAGSTKLLPEQERQITERVRDLDAWEAVCREWQKERYGFLGTENMLDRYCKLEASYASERPVAASGLNKLEREIWELPGLSDEDKAQHCAELLDFLVEDRKQYVENLRQHLASGGRKGAHS